MEVDPNQIHLTPQQQLYVARQSERLGKPWAELLEQFVPAIVDHVQEETAYDAAKRLGLIGGIRSGQGDLSTNADHMEGFGE